MLAPTKINKHTTLTNKLIGMMQGFYKSPIAGTGKANPL